MCAYPLQRPLDSNLPPWGPGEQTQVSALGSKLLCPLSLLTGPSFSLSFEGVLVQEDSLIAEESEMGPGRGCASVRPCLSVSIQSVGEKKPEPKEASREDWDGGPRSLGLASS